MFVCRVWASPAAPVNALRQPVAVVRRSSQMSVRWHRSSALSGDQPLTPILGQGAEFPARSARGHGSGKFSVSGPGRERGRRTATALPVFSQSGEFQAGAVMVRGAGAVCASRQRASSGRPCSTARSSSWAFRQVRVLGGEQGSASFSPSAPVGARPNPRVQATCSAGAPQAPDAERWAASP